jgi:sugar phosphate isomerase/epimerase
MDEFVDKAAALGYDGVLLMAKRPHLPLLDYGAAERLALRKRIDGHGLRVAIASYNNFTADWEHADIPQLELQVHYVVGLARLARDLGGNLVRVFTAYEHPTAPFREQWHRVESALKECARRTIEFGVTIGVQNHHDIAVGYESQYDLIKAVDEPNCRALFDAWAPALHGDDLNSAAQLMAPVTVHTTIANYQLRPRSHYTPALVNYTKAMPSVEAVPIDEGFIDYKAFLTAMIEGGFRGSVAYEMCSPLRGGGAIDNLDSYANRFLEFLQGITVAAGAGVFCEKGA